MGRYDLAPLTFTAKETVFIIIFNSFLTIWAEVLQLRQLVEKHGIPFEPVEKALQV
jgi:hypothetical protein